MTTPTLDPDRLRDLFQAHWDHLVNYANKLVRDIELARDLVADVFATYCLRPAAPHPGALYVAVKRAALDHGRHRAVELTYHARIVQDAEEADAMALPLEATEEYATVQAAMAGLPPQQREVLRRRWTGQSDRMIAAALGISVKTVGEHKRRAIAHLQAALPDFLTVEP